jgi:predicted secreted Zn-dependent protease
LPSAEPHQAQPVADDAHGLLECGSFWNKDPIMSKYAAVFSGLVFMVGAGEAHADVKLDVTYSTYQLRGLNLKAIHDDLHRVAKKDRDGIIDGEVSDAWDWNFRFAAAENSCRVSSDEIILKLNILLPTWVDEARADPGLRTAWDTYFQKLKAHEDGHKSIAVDAADRISKLTHGATAPVSCTALDQSLNRAAKQIVHNAEEAQDQFDANPKPFDLE